MSLIDAIQGFDAESRLQLIKPSLSGLAPVERRLVRMADGLDKAIPDPSPDIIVESLDALRSRQLPSARSTKLLCMGGLATLAEQHDGKSLIRNLLDGINEKLSPPLLKALLIGYLRLVEDTGWLSDLIRKFLVRHFKNLPSLWKSRVTSYDLLSESRGQNVASLLLKHPHMNPHEVLHEAGLRGVLSSGGMAKLVFKRLSERLSQGHNDGVLERFWSYIGTDKPPFESEIALYCTALLTPYVSENPVDAVRVRIERFIFGRYGDPRLKQGTYAGVQREHLAVLHRWLTQQSIELLMEVVKSSNDTRHWQERSVFWRHYIDNEYVSEAWIAFGSNAHRQARALVRQGLLNSHGAYARLESGTVNAMHSVLFMRLGDIIITEWTHDGKVRGYLHKNPRAPKFYRQSYAPEVIRDDDQADFFKSHHNGWQDVVADYIYRQTGIPGPNDKRARSVGMAKVDKASSTNSKHRPYSVQIASCSSCQKPKRAESLDDKGLCIECRGIAVKRR